MKRVGALFVVAAAVLAVALVLSVPGKAAAAKRKLTIGTASVGGAYYPVGTGIAGLINKYVPEVEVRVEVTGGSVENPRLVGSGETDLGITNSNLGYFAEKGHKPYPKALPVVAIAHMYPSVLHMITRQDMPYRTIEDLKGRRIAAGPAGGGTMGYLRVLVPALGMSLKDFKLSFISYNDGSLALRDGNVDAMFALAGAPTSSVLELATRTPIRFLELKESFIDRFVKQYPFYMRVEIPASVYKTKKPAVVLGVGNVLIVNAKMSDDLAYKIAAALFDHIDEFRKVHPATKGVRLKLAPKTAMRLHPGAIRYYKEKGVLK